MVRASANHEGRQTVYEVTVGTGQRAPALCIHGPAATRAVWRKQAALAEERPIAALDLSGHGDSNNIEAESGWETLSAYSSDVATVVQELDANLLVGHSLGAMVAVHALANRSIAIDGLVIIGAGVRVPVSRDILTLAREDREALREFLLEPGRLLFDPQQPTVETVEEAIDGCQPGVVRRDFFTCQRANISDELSGIDIPTLVLAGEFDRLTPPEQCAKAAATLPRGLFRTIGDAAHLPMLEQPTAMHEILREFFEDPAATIPASA